MKKWITMAIGVQRYFEGIMPDEQKPKERKKKPAVPETIEPEKETEGSILASAAKAIGAAAGKIASLAGVVPSRPKAKKTPKLQKKNKSRLPRRQKKAQHKVAATKSDV